MLPYNIVIDLYESFNNQIFHPISKINPSTIIHQIIYERRHVFSNSCFQISRYVQLKFNAIKLINLNIIFSDIL